MRNKILLFMLLIATTFLLGIGYGKDVLAE